MSGQAVSRFTRARRSAAAAAAAAAATGSSAPAARRRDAAPAPAVTPTRSRFFARNTSGAVTAAAAAARGGVAKSATPPEPARKRSRVQGAGPGEGATAASATVAGVTTKRRSRDVDGKQRRTGASSAASVGKATKASAGAGRSRAESTPPDDFAEVWRVVERLRHVRDAPVDLHGAEALAGWTPPGAAPPSEEEKRFGVLVALMLSSQTKDDVVGEAVRALKERCEARRARPFGPSFVLSLTASELDGIIFRVGFHNNKTKFLHAASEMLLDPSFAPGARAGVGHVPSTAEALLKLPGVGPKMTYIVLAVGFGEASAGVGVDTHMHRIFRDLGWVPESAHKRGPDATRKAVEAWLPRERWAAINLLFVGFGQQAQQRRFTMLRRCCGADPAYPHFPEDESVPALRLLARAGGVATAPGRAYVAAVEKATRETPLMWAAASGWLATVEHLLEVGCRAAHEDAAGRTAAEHAEAAGHAAVAELLRRAAERERPS